MCIACVCARGRTWNGSACVQCTCVPSSVYFDSINANGSRRSIGVSQHTRRLEVHASADIKFRETSCLYERLTTTRRPTAACNAAAVSGRGGQKSSVKSIGSDPLLGFDTDKAI